VDAGVREALRERLVLDEELDFEAGSRISSRTRMISSSGRPQGTSWCRRLRDSDAQEGHGVTVDYTRAARGL